MTYYVFDFMHNKWLSSADGVGEWSSDAIDAVAFKREIDAIKASDRLGGTVFQVIA